MKIWLSYSTLYMIHNSAHEWICKQAGLTFVENEFMKQGKEGHRIVQDHISGKKPSLFLKDVLDGVNFSIVEEKQFDERTKFVKNMTLDGIDYCIQGFADGLNAFSWENPTDMAEIKLSGTPWTVGKFQKAMQRKFYKFLCPSLERGTIISGKREPESWIETMRVGDCPMTDADGKEGEEYLMKGIERLKRIRDIVKNREEGSGLDQNGKCSNQYCGYGDGCMFK